MQGVDWVTANAVKPAVANMSLGSQFPIAALNTAVRNSAATRIFYAIAAGNGNPLTTTRRSMPVGRRRRAPDTARTA